MAISVLQLDDVTLYGSGLALLEQNLHTLNSQGVFDKTVCFKTVAKLEVDFHANIATTHYYTWHLRLLLTIAKLPKKLSHVIALGK